MSTRELRCRFDHEEEGAPVCGECRRCCDALKARVAELGSAEHAIRVKLSRVLRLDASHGPSPASMEFILESINAVIVQIVGTSNARLTSEPMMRSETERLRSSAAELEANVNNVWAVLEDVVATSARAFPDDRTKWIALRLRNLAQELEDRYRPLDEEVPETKQP